MTGTPPRGLWKWSPSALRTISTATFLPTPNKSCEISSKMRSNLSWCNLWDLLSFPTLPFLPSLPSLRWGTGSGTWKRKKWITFNIKTNQCTFPSPCPPHRWATGPWVGRSWALSTARRAGCGKPGRQGGPASVTNMTKGKVQKKKLKKNLTSVSFMYVCVAENGEMLVFFSFFSPTIVW